MKIIVGKIFVESDNIVIFIQQSLKEFGAESLKIGSFIPL